MAPRWTLYGYPISHYCVSVERMLAFKGVDVRSVRVPYHDKRVLLRATGQDYVPALVAGRTVVRWDEIPDFLDRAHPDPTLHPVGRAGLARVIEHWAHQVLEERVWRVAVTRVPSTLSDPVERWVFEEMQTRSRGPFDRLAARLPEYRRDLNAHLALVEGMLDGHAWILDDPSVADFGVFGALAPLACVGERLPSTFPNLKRWHRAIERLPGTLRPTRARPRRRG